MVEGGCKNVVGGRLKQSGMRWTKDGTDAILALRCCVLSGRYEDFWEWRSNAAPPQPPDPGKPARPVLAG